MVWSAIDSYKPAGVQTNAHTGSPALRRLRNVTQGREGSVPPIHILSNTVFRAECSPPHLKNWRYQPESWAWLYCWPTDSRSCPVMSEWVKVYFLGLGSCGPSSEAQGRNVTESLEVFRSCGLSHAEQACRGDQNLSTCSDSHAAMPRSGSDEN